MVRKAALILAGLGLAGILTGCGLRSPEELYALPKPTAEYQSLQTCLDALVARGYEYSAPMSGANTQSVQMQDLDGDGVDEALAFFRDSSSGAKYPMKICIFRAGGEGDFSLATTIEGDGEGINSVVYCQLNDTPMQEIVVGWRVSSAIYALSAYSIEQDVATEIISAPSYTRYFTRDLDQDNQAELVLIQVASQEDGGSSATYYDWSDDTMMSINTTRLSTSMTSVDSAKYGCLQSGYPALYISGYRQDSPTQLITDILAVRDGALTNITISDGMDSTSTIRSSSVDIKDINNDSVLEIPIPTQLPSNSAVENSENFSLLQWEQYSLDGARHFEGYTYHNLADGWYFDLPDEWYGHIILARSDISLGATVERSIVFYHQTSPTDQPEPFMAIYKNTGSNRLNRAEIGQRKLLKTDADAAYSLEFFDSSWECSMDYVSAAPRFHLILTDWSTD